MSKLTKKQIDELKNKTMVELLCDGFNVKVYRTIIKNKVRFFLRINDELNFDWMFEPTKHTESKIFRPNIIYRKMSKRSKKMTKYDTGSKKIDYASMGQALRYFNKVCDSVEVISVNGVPVCSTKDSPKSVTRKHCEVLIDEVLGEKQ